MIGHQCPEDYQDHQANATSLVSSFCTLEDLAQTFGKGSEPVIDSTKTSVNSELQLVKRLRGVQETTFLYPKEIKKMELGWPAESIFVFNLAHLTLPEAIASLNLLYSTSKTDLNFPKLIKCQMIFRNVELSG